MPFAHRMSREVDDGWLQWMPRDCIVIPGWLYCLLGLTWPLLLVAYPRRLLGQVTDYGRRPVRWRP